MTAAAAEAPPDSLRELFASLGAAGLRWTLLRPREGLARPQGDVDILVEPGAFAAVGHALAEHGYVRMLMDRPDLHAARHDPQAGRFFWIHVQGSLELAGATVAATPVLDASTPGEVPEPGPDWLLWILLLRALVDKGDLADHHRARVAALARDWAGGPDELLAIARGHGFDCDALVTAAAARDWTSLLAHSKALPGAPSPSWPRRLTGAFRLARGLRRRTGLSVAVLGPDGAGKTTLVDGLQRSLPVQTHVQYMGLTGGRLPRADALRVPGLVLAARLAILWLRYGRGVLHQARGRIVLFERYTLDGAVPSGIPLSPLGRLSRRVQRHACPTPDVVLLLDASGDTMHARKGEYDPTVLETWRASYRNLGERVAALSVLDAEQPAEHVRLAAEAIIWRRYTERLAARTGRDAP